MGFMMRIYPGEKAKADQEVADINATLVEAMVAFNQRLVDAGVRLGGDGLYPTMRGARQFGLARLRSRMDRSPGPRKFLAVTG